MCPANDNPEFLQCGRLPDVVVDTALNQVHRGGPAVVVGHHHHGQAEIADFVEESKLLLHRIRARIKVHDQDIALPLQNDFPHSVHAALEEDGEFAAERRRELEVQIGVLRIEQVTDHSDFTIPGV